MAEQTPFDAALSLHQAGAVSETIKQMLVSRGLDSEAVGMVMRSVLARSRTAPVEPPKESWVEAPAALEPIAAPAVEATAPSAPLTCTRCGAFCAPAEIRHFKKLQYCAACFARPDVNYLEAYKQKVWGKRDGWSWFYGVLSALAGLGGAAAVGAAIISGKELNVLGVVQMLGAAIVYGLYCAGMPVARVGLVLVTITGAAIALIGGGAGGFTGVLFTIGALTSTRNKLFFKIDVKEEELEKLWAANNDNRAALWSRGLGIVSLLAIIPAFGLKQAIYVSGFVGVWALVTGGAGLKAVNPAATPPVGRKGTAIAGLVMGGLAVVASALLLAFWNQLR